jgi:hypothetical protein
MPSWHAEGQLYHTVTTVNVLRESCVDSVSLLKVTAVSHTLSVLPTSQVLDIPHICRRFKSSGMLHYVLQFVVPEPSTWIFSNTIMATLNLPTHVCFILTAKFSAQGGSSPWHVYSRHHFLYMLMWLAFRLLCADRTQRADAGRSDSYHECAYMLHSCHGWLLLTTSVCSLCQDGGKQCITSGTTHTLALSGSFITSGTTHT